jgi:hypothetical protein
MFIKRPAEFLPAFFFLLLSFIPEVIEKSMSFLIFGEKTG